MANFALNGFNKFITTLGDFFLTFDAADQRVGSPPSVFLASQRRVGGMEAPVVVAGEGKHVAVDEAGQLGLPLVDDVGRCSVERRDSFADWDIKISLVY